MSRALIDPILFRYLARIDEIELSKDKPKTLYIPDIQCLISMALFWYNKDQKVDKEINMT
jgi:hypothetical protein